MSFSEWREVTVAETIITSNTGLDAIKRAPIVEFDTGIKCLRIQDISQEKSFKDWGYCKVEARNYQKFCLKKGDIIVARTGATIGVNRLIKSDLKSVYNNGLIRIKINPEIIDYRYLFFNMQSDKYKGHIDAISGGTSTQPNMKMNALLDFEIKLPPLLEQKAIADTLSCLDDKIEINKRINKTLEEMAQAIFKSWFVDFEPFQDGKFEDTHMGKIPVDWVAGRLSDIVTVKYGKDHKKLADGNIPVYGSGGIMRYANDALYSLESVLIPRKGTLNNIIYVNEPFWSVDTMFFTESKVPSAVKFFFFFMKSKDLSSMNVGSAVPSMTTDVLNKMDIIIPPEKILTEYDKIVSPLFLQIGTNKKEADMLSNIRNSLLPKLMSGEIRIPIQEVQ